MSTMTPRLKNLLAQLKVLKTKKAELKKLYQKALKKEARKQEETQ